MKTSNRIGIRTCSDYSPYGVELDGRTVSGGYRYEVQLKMNKLEANSNDDKNQFGEETVNFDKHKIHSCEHL